MRLTDTSSMMLSLAAIASATSDLSPRTDPKTNIYVCTDANWAGTCRNIAVTPGKCYNMPAAFDKKISSTGPDEGTFCTLHSGRNCKGDKVIPFTNPGIADFTKYKFDNELRSVRCNYIWGWPEKSA